MGGYMYILGPCGPLPQTLLWGWEFFPLPQLLQIFTSRGWSLVSHSGTLGSTVCLPSQWFFPAYRPTNVRPTGPPATFWVVHPLHLSCLSSPLLPVWMNVSLTPWLSDFHQVWISGSSGCTLFLNLLLSFFWLCKEVKHCYVSIMAGTPGLLSPNSWRISAWADPCIFFEFSPEDMFINFRKRGRERERVRKKYRCERKTAISRLPYVHQPGIEPAT